MTESAQDSRHRRRKRHGSKQPAQPQPPAPAKVVAEALKAPQEQAWVEEPLTPAEIARLKVHFKFLKEHRHLLKLRVNAAEDLLLNGVKEPTHRGLCQHLLAKVERSRVLTVSQNMPADQAVRLLSGIIRFAPDIAYILRYLECVKSTASQQQAGAALTEALKQIDFTELSAAQMRQLVALIVDVFAERDLPVFLFTLLYDKSFREALDRSLDGFPEVLGRMLRPLRVVHEMVAHAVPRGVDFTADMQALKTGVTLLFDVNPASLEQLPEAAQQRLFHVGCQTLRSQPGVCGEPLLQLLAGLTFSQDSDRAATTLELAQALLIAGHEALARKCLDRNKNGPGSPQTLTRFREVLDYPRVGRVAIEQSHGNGKLPPPGRWFRGWHLASGDAVLVRLGASNEQPAFAEQVQSWRQLLVSGVSRVVSAQTDAASVLHVAVELPGMPVYREVKRAHRLSEATRLGWVVQLCALLDGLASSGVMLADAQLNRFNVDQDGRLWLVDLWPLRRAEPEVARQAHLGQARAACRQLLDNAPCYSLAPGAFEQIEQVQSLRELAALFEPC